MSWPDVLRDALRSPEDRKAALVLATLPFLLLGLRPLDAGEPEGLASSLFARTFLGLGVLPALAARLLFREPLSRSGLALGDLRAGARAVLLLSPVMIALGLLASRSATFRAAYPLSPAAGRSPGLFLAHAGGLLAFYAGWESYFRGFVLFGLRGRLGGLNAVLVQTVASSLAHLGKPEPEAYGAVVGGLVWGALALRTGSILPPLLLHWLLGLSLDFFLVHA